MKKLKPLFAVVGAGMIAYVILSASAAGAPQEPPQESGYAAEQAAYVLCEENNRVVVYRGGTLWLSTDTRVSELPKSDRVRLRRGVTVYSEEELKRLLEDYCS